MKKALVLRCIGVVCLLLGLVLAANPELVSSQPIPSDTFRAVERRIWWGLLIGVGLLLQFHHQLRPWVATFAATCSTLIFGLLVARFIGIALDGSVLKQWLYVALEAALVVPLAWWYWRVRA